MLFQPKTTDLKRKFLDLQSRPMQASIKRHLMESLLHEIKSISLPSSRTDIFSPICSQKNLQISDTNFTSTFSSRNNVLPAQNREQFECKIIQQQKFKMQLYEEIQLHQDDLFQLEKVIKSKKQYEQNLDRRIFQLQYLIQKNSKNQPSEQKHQKKPLSTRIKKFFM